ncbi:FecR protein [Arachidicoccus rhizosphaerae]|uniref:FecR protein n=2 Tax=Arachidicoccus rhizosphaerae TaxID=551991 RepID=A0A1H3XNF0_9BACT|nr:FecR protein [Arachidicoccus rhizosphaerae]
MDSFIKWPYINMEQEEIEDIIERYFKGLTSEEEDQKLSLWYEEMNLRGKDDSGLRDEDFQTWKKQMLLKLIKQARALKGQNHLNFTVQENVENDKKQNAAEKGFSWNRWGWAAAILILFCFSIMVYRLQFQKSANKQQVAKEEMQGLPGQNIAAGHNGAILHLSNGQVILLDSLQNGVVTEQNGVKILKDKNGLVYVGQAKETLYNDITTSRGQQWSLTLPDGTKVWLNAVSSIHYPLAFNGKDRIVSIKGEAYFEVVHNESQPFKVQVGNTMIEDIGTEFNINAYDDEASIKTTLLNGSVKVSAGSGSHVLIPGEQAETDNSHIIKISKVNTENVTGWVNGEMIFDNEMLEEVMKKVSRWYDIDVTYSGKIPNRKFTGSISRKLNLSEFLKLLEFENVDYKIQGKQLTILP